MVYLVDPDRPDAKSWAMWVILGMLAVSFGVILWAAVEGWK